MTTLTAKSCDEFIGELASASPAPGGGGAAALVGALGTALGNMVGSLTVKYPRYADVHDDIRTLKAKADGLQARLVALVTRDAEVFEPLSQAWSLPRDTEQERAQRAKVIEAALQECCEVPLEIMECCCEAIELQEQFARKGAELAISDAGCGAVCCAAALRAAALNVFANTVSMTDRVFATEANRRAHELLATGTTRADAVFADVAKRLT
jgi:formiminotetrahydrofolate cyclodeaminase